MGVGNSVIRESLKRYRVINLPAAFAPTILATGTDYVTWKRHKCEVRITYRATNTTPSVSLKCATNMTNCTYDKYPYI